MESKKNPKADLENKKGMFFLIGLVVVLATKARLPDFEF